VQFTLRTRVAQPVEAVFPVFGEAAFVESLAPRFMGLRVTKIGLKLGDEIQVQFTRLGPRGPWVSRIDSMEQGEPAIWFVDRSIELPWPFSAFHHRHGFVRDGTGTLLVDNPTFSVSPGILGIFVYPVLRLSFGMRRGVYRKRFGPPAGTPGEGVTPP
jgi:ligand-binding SRPBCC domain-containing protein